VLAYPQFTIFDDVSAVVTDGVVILQGKVTMPFKKNDIEKRVAKVPGVTRVDNRVSVLPVSQFDDELRYAVARAIYGSSAFWHYASMVNPPIHIVVENGRVRLTGVVASDVERMLARSLATSFNAFSVTNDLRTDAEMKALLDRKGVN
jgi:hyperosmotically inducible protein